MKHRTLRTVCKLSERVDGASKADPSNYAFVGGADMSRYYFDIWDGRQKAHDDVGVECHSDRAASVQATIALTELARDILPGDGPARYLKIDVRTGTATLFSVALHFEVAPPNVARD
jgi:hypothetical protein